MKQTNDETWMRRALHKIVYYLIIFFDSIGIVNRYFLYLFYLLIFAVTGFVLYVTYIFLSQPNVEHLVDTNPTTTAFIEYRKEEALDKGDTLQIDHQWISIKELPRQLRRTIIISEDASFWVHKGFDWYELENALRDRFEEGKPLRGASTITQQTAKNLFLTPERSLVRKFREFLISRDLEKHLTKTRILELYLNSIEFGKGIFGIKSAAGQFFGKTPAQLKLSEMVRLAAILPAPLQLDPTFASEDLQIRAFVILKRLRKHKWATEAEYQKARRELNAFFK